MQRFNIIGLFEPPVFSNGGAMVLRQERTGDNTTSPVFAVRGGFSLIEILVAVSIGAVLTTFSLVAFNQIGKGGSLTRTGSEISDLLEQARAYAMARNTYVWVGFTQSGPDSLVAGVVSSRNGDAHPTAEDLVPLDHIRRFERVRVVSLDASAERPAAEDEAQVANLSSPILEFSIAGAKPVTFDTQVIQFDSRGECRIAQDQPYRITEIGLQEVVDGQIRNRDNSVAIQIGGLSGAVSLYRP